MKPIYLDYNATTPVDPRVAEAMLPYVETHFGNPSSGHDYGRTTREAVEKARGQIAAMLGCRPDEIIFTSGGSEANNFAIKGVAGAYREKGNHIITSTVEHPAVTEVCRFLETRGCEVTYIPVDKYGLVDPARVAEAITPKTILISIMHANNEVGTIEPIAEIGRIAREKGVLMHTDAAQSIGKIPVDVGELNVDLLSVAGHKVYGPKGIGALYIGPGVKLEKQIHGAGHEYGRRAGTENVLEIVGLGEAAAIIAEESDDHVVHLAKLRDRLEDNLRQRLEKIIRLNGHPEKRLPNTASISFTGFKANELLNGMPGIAASAGAACHSDDVKISSVLKAMKVPVIDAIGTIRFSVGRFTTEKEVDRAIEIIDTAIKKSVAP